MEIIAFLITLILGYFGDLFFGNFFNIYDGGAILSIATIGTIILYTINNKNN